MQKSGQIQKNAPFERPTRWRLTNNSKAILPQTALQITFSLPSIGGFIQKLDNAYTVHQSLLFFKNIKPPEKTSSITFLTQSRIISELAQC